MPESPERDINNVPMGREFSRDVPHQMVAAGSLEVDMREKTVRCGGGEWVTPGRVVFAILSALLRQSPSLVPTSVIIQSVYGDLPPDDNGMALVKLRTSICNLKKFLARWPLVVVKSGGGGLRAGYQIIVFETAEPARVG